MYERRVVTRVGSAEGVAHRAIGARLGSEALMGLLGCMLDARFFRVALGAASGRYLSDGIAGELVALATGNLLADHMHQVTTDLACRLPYGVHVHATSRGRTRASRISGLGTRGSKPEQQGHHEARRKETPTGSSHGGSHDSPGGLAVRQSRDSLAVRAAWP